MNRASGKQTHRRLNRKSYRNLHRQIVERDGWRCQGCGRMRLLEVHHKEFRSHSGEDTEENLITLCAECHVSIHQNVHCRSLFKTSDSIQRLASWAAP